MKDVIFIWIPKNAGTSIYTAMNKEFGMRKLKMPEEYSKFNNRGMVTFGHVSIPYLLDKEYISGSFMNNVTSFAFVRNPWDRVVSLFLYFKKHKIIIPQNWTFEQFCERLRHPIEPVGHLNRHGFSQCNPQVKWLFNDKRSLYVDFIGRVENLQEDFNQVTDYLNLKRVKVPHENHISQNGEEFYNDRLINMIGEIYKEDIDKFNYSYGV